MPDKPEPRRRLAELMEERRLELDLRWQDVASAGDVSLKTLHSVRTGSAGISPLTRRKIEKGLRWGRGSVGRILDGGDPEPLYPALYPVPGAPYAEPDEDSYELPPDLQHLVDTDRAAANLWDLRHPDYEDRRRPAKELKIYLRAYKHLQEEARQRGRNSQAPAGTGRLAALGP